MIYAPADLKLLISPVYLHEISPASKYGYISLDFSVIVCEY